MLPQIVFLWNPKRDQSSIKPKRVPVCYEIAASARRGPGRLRTAPQASPASCHREPCTGSRQTLLKFHLQLISSFLVISCKYLTQNRNSVTRQKSTRFSLSLLECKQSYHPSFLPRRKKIGKPKKKKSLHSSQSCFVKPIFFLEHNADLYTEK